MLSLYDTLTRENTALDADIKSFEEREKSMLARSTAVQPDAAAILTQQQHRQYQGE